MNAMDGAVLDLPSHETREALSPAPELSLVVPTFNEAENVAPLLDSLRKALAGVSWEVVFVDDDSTDGTVAAVRAAARADSRIRLVHRIGRRGLSSAVVEGIQSTTAPFVAVMDADLQHDETLLPRMLERLRESEADVVVGSRYMAGGGTGAWAADRRLISRIATQLAAIVLRVRFSDPMSGFFMLRREAFDGSVRQLSGQGYKILLDIAASAQSPLKVEELPYTFRSRIHGESKLDTLAVVDYLTLLADKAIGHIVPVSFLMFAGVGGLGVLVHLSIMALTFRTGLLDFAAAQTTAALSAMTFNFFLNNLLTFRDRRLKGFGPIVRGLLSFYLVCSIGLIGNVGVASYLFDRNSAWWLAGLAGILIGAVWDFVGGSVFTWGRKR